MLFQYSQSRRFGFKMAFTASNVYFKTTHAYLSQDDWVTQAGLHSQHETDQPVMLYENEFAINPNTNLLLCNKYGELIIRQKIDDGEYVYYLIVFDNRECRTCDYSYLGYSHSDFSQSLEYILDKYFNDDESDCYALVYPETPELDNDNDNELSDSISTTLSYEVVDTEKYGKHTFTFTSDASIIPSINILNSNYSKKYNILVKSDKTPLQTHNGYYISRINKENGKHRYYLTEVRSELETDDICYKAPTMFYIFKSRYVGTSLDNILQEYVYVSDNGN